MAGHNATFDLFRVPEAADPGNAKTLLADRCPYVVALVSATAETRTLARPTQVGTLAFIYMRTDGGDITLTVTGAYDESGTTTFTFSDPGQFICLMSAYDGSAYYWRKISDHAAAGTSPTESAFLSGVTAGTALASKAVVLDSGGDVTWVDGGDIALGTVTGTKIGTATSQKLAFYNSTPITKPSAYTQTYATADKTHANPTATTLTVTDGVGTNNGTIDAITNNASTITAVQELAAMINALIVDLADTKQLVNSVIDDLQALGLVA